MEKKNESDVGLVFLTMLVVGMVLAVMGVTVYIINLKKELKEARESQPNQVVVRQDIPEYGEIEDDEDIEEVDRPEPIIDEKEVEVSNQEITYKITINDETSATIEAIKNGKTFSKEVETQGAIYKTGTIDLEDVGTIALICNSDRDLIEFKEIFAYQLVNDEIRLLGRLNGLPEKNVDYSFEIEDEAKIKITAKSETEDEDVIEEIEMSAAIVNASVVNVFGIGDFVFVSETGGEYYGIKVFGLVHGYADGELYGIEEFGTLVGMFDFE